MHPVPRRPPVNVLRRGTGDVFDVGNPSGGCPRARPTRHVFWLADHPHVRDGRGRARLPLRVEGQTVEVAQRLASAERPPGLSRMDLPRPGVRGPLPCALHTCIFAEAAGALADRRPGESDQPGSPNVSTEAGSATRRPHRRRAPGDRPGTAARAPTAPNRPGQSARPRRPSPPSLRKRCPTATGRHPTSTTPTRRIAPTPRAARAPRGRGSTAHLGGADRPWPPV